MRITVVGRGNVGGGLAKRWEQAGHEVTALGRDGGDAADAEVVVVAVPSNAIADALGKVSGIEGKIGIDATNVVGDRDERFESMAHKVKSIVGGPTAKSFNLNFARLYDQLDQAERRPSNIWSGDEEARQTVEQLTRDAGYDPISAGGLDKAAVQEQGIGLIFAISQASGPFFYRMAPPGEL